MLRARHPGVFRVLLGDEERTTFEVRPIGGEWQDPAPDFELLRELASTTGGSFVTLAEIDALPARIPDATVTEIVGRRAATVWDSATLLLLFAALLSAEWILRKLWNLN